LLSESTNRIKLLIREAVNYDTASLPAQEWSAHFRWRKTTEGKMPFMQKVQKKF